MSDFTISGLIEVSIDSLNEALRGVSDFADDISGQLGSLKDAANESIAVFQGFGALSLGGIAVFSEMDLPTIILSGLFTKSVSTS